MYKAREGSAPALSTPPLPKPGPGHLKARPAGSSPGGGPEPCVKQGRLGVGETDELKVWTLLRATRQPWAMTRKGCGAEMSLGPTGDGP